MYLEQISDEEISLWLAFQSISGLGPKRILLLYDRFQGIAPAWEASKIDLMTIAGMSGEAAEGIVRKRKEINPEQLLQAARKDGVRPVTFNDPDYPHYLRQIVDPPLVIFVLGDISTFRFEHVVAVVGTRRSSTYGQRIAKEWAKKLSELGIAVSSGLAIGIDSYAHWGAIEGGGKTIAVVGTGPDVIYPSSNRRLHKAILETNGLVISEFMPGTTPEKWHFPQRNRIISGISQAVLVVEGAEDSGALITAKLAFEQNRDVFAIPGRLDMSMSKAPNRLIKDQQAQLAIEPMDILKAMNWTPTTINQITTIVELYGREREIYEMLSSEPVHFDVLCERAGMQPGEMSATLTMLELAGLLERHSGDWYTLQNGSVPRIGQMLQ